MPVYPCSNGKWRIGTGPCIYTSEAAAERAWAGYRTARGKPKEPRRDGSGRGTRDNRGRGGCPTTEPTGRGRRSA